MYVKSLFKLMADTKASDLFFTAGSPVQIKIKGDVVPVDANVLDSAATKRICYQAMTEEQIAHFEKEMEINFSLVEPGVGSFADGEEQPDVVLRQAQSFAELRYVGRQERHFQVRQRNADVR